MEPDKSTFNEVKPKVIVIGQRRFGKSLMLLSAMLEHVKQSKVVVPYIESDSTARTGSVVYFPSSEEFLDAYDAEAEKRRWKKPYPPPKTRNRFKKK